jgi:hypothetical protein
LNTWTSFTTQGVPAERHLSRRDEWLRTSFTYS